MTHASAPESAVSADDIRQAMRVVPSAVTVITIGGESPRGITIGSFVTVSLEPPLVSFNVQRAARMHDHLAQSERFAVHVLAANQSRLSEIFADPDLSGRQQLEQVAHVMDADGIPSLDGILARFECDIVNQWPAGDHSIFLGHVRRLTFRETSSALLYLNQGYTSVAP